MDSVTSWGAEESTGRGGRGGKGMGTRGGNQRGGRGGLKGGKGKKKVWLGIRRGRGVNGEREGKEREGRGEKGAKYGCLIPESVM